VDGVAEGHQERVAPSGAAVHDPLGAHRDRPAQARLDAAALRDQLAEERDVAARERDEAAELRGIEMADLDAASQRDEDNRALTGAEVVVRHAGQRKRAVRRRAQAARQRELSARDREAAARDRRDAELERLDARKDLEALVAEVRDEQRRRDRAQRHQHRAEALARTLQRSLSPPRLPDVAGVDVAVHYEPFAIEEVGGDFYDLFPLAGGRSGFFLGDVCGKGPEAASLTSLARYTMRTAAMLREQPDAILLDLNDALLMEAADAMQTCTVVYGQIDPSDDAAVIALAVAGHPPPLVVRAHGAVEVLPARGTILGVVTNPEFRACSVRLNAGDAIVLYSDGILDTSTDGVRADEQRIADLLEGPPQASAQALVDRLVLALGRVDGPLRDDVALMVLRRTTPS
jgi:serine phosphatase RsbU (regulator of sigma subunit)